MTSLVQQLLRLVASGDFVSGQALAEQLGVSRAAVWKAVRELKGCGVGVFAVRGRGYRLPQPVEPLSETRLNELLAEAGCRPERCQVHFRVDSTNRIAAADLGPGIRVHLAEYQSAGRGRRGRDWVAPLGASVLLSIAWRSDHGPAALTGLSLVVGLAVARALRARGLDTCGVKWPNDLVVDGAKLGGVLLEVSGEASGPSRVVIGIGVNYDLGWNPPAIDQAWTDVSRHISVCRNELAAAVIAEVVSSLGLFERKGFAPFRDAWETTDVLRGRPVAVLLPRETRNGIALGVDEHGQLVVDEAGRRVHYGYGEVSLRAEVADAAGV